MASSLRSVMNGSSPLNVLQHKVSLDVGKFFGKFV